MAALHRSKFLQFKLRLATLLLGFAFIAPAGAEQLLIGDAEVRIRIGPEVQVLKHVARAGEESFTLEDQGEVVQVRWRPDDLWVNLSEGVLRIKRHPGRTQDTWQLVADYSGERFTVGRGPREISWRLPQEDVFFQTRGGYVQQALGNSDHLKIRRDTPGRQVTVESRSGESVAKLGSKGLEVIDGPELENHRYFVRGLAFQLGAITVELPLPEDIFTKALAQDRYLTLIQRSVPEREPTQPASQFKERPAHPLQAEPATWNSPSLRAVEVDRNEDPIRAKKEQRPDRKQGDPLKAITEKDSEELLRVKDY